FPLCFSFCFISITSVGLSDCSWHLSNRYNRWRSHIRLLKFVKREPL
uniref:Uncharacterized protein n=1 Tax=Parascaris univalens TaxID=6257 RepID=A0A915BBB0_PARUN